MKLYKLTDKKGQTLGGTQWGPGVTHEAAGEGTDAASGTLSVHESCPVCTPDPDVVLVHTPKPDAPLSK